MGSSDFELPIFLHEVVSQSAYDRWLRRKAAAHVRRDRKRGRFGAAYSNYRKAIHSAVIESGGKDAYTGEALDWELISKYDNRASKEGRHRYKAALAMLPTIDHVDAASTSSTFRICAWRTNDSKNDLTFEGFIALCTKVLVNAGYVVERSE
jgi:hypothetical protein